MIVGAIAIFLREKAIKDKVEATLLRKKRKAAKMQAKAQAQATKTNNFDVTVETTLAETRSDLNAEIASFGKAKGALKSYLQEQFKSRKLLHFGNYSTIPLQSEFRSKAKPYPLRMNPEPVAGKNSNSIYANNLTTEPVVPNDC